MELIARLGEREERVRVEAVDGGFVVTVGERAYRVDAVAAGRGLKSLRIEGAQHEVAVRRLAEGRYAVTAGGRAQQVEVSDPLTHLARKARRGTGPRGSRKVTAMMPGRVVAVLVEEGQPVEPGQGIVVLEAMKMENEIGTEHGGIVKHVFVQNGQAVEGGDPLFEIG